MPGALSFAGAGVRATQISLDDANLLRGIAYEQNPTFLKRRERWGIAGPLRNNCDRSSGS
jgi:hypothetical protein